MHLPAWLLVFLVLGATHRLARLVTEDYVMEWLRDRINRRDRKLGNTAEEPGALAYLITCPWCVSMYAAIPVTVGALWWGTNRVVIAVLLVLTASAFAGGIAQLEE